MDNSLVSNIKISDSVKSTSLPIADLQERPIVFWSLAAIADELFISMMDVKVRFCMLVGSKDVCARVDPRLPRRLYEEQAGYKMYRVPIFRPVPVFVVHLKHLDDRLKQELSSLDRENKDDVMKEAVGRICEGIDKRFYLQSVRPLLKWRLEN
jgi:hypothetical protein